jgi:hypothetical protein
MGKPRDRQRLQPDPPRPSECRKKDTIAAKDHILDTGHPLNLEPNAGLKCPNVPWVHSQRITWSNILDHQLAGEFKPRDALPANLLQQKAIPAKDACTKRLLKADPSSMFAVAHKKP